jgi:hypothetical protein
MKRSLFCAALMLSACSTSSSLDSGKLEDQIEQWFQSGAQVTTTVTCPDNEPLQQGDTFKCTALTNDGLTLTVQVTQTDNTGGVTWQQVPSS